MDQYTHLYIFVTSNSPDVYINVIRHCIEHYKLDKEINFINIYEDKDKRGTTESYLNTVIDRVTRQLSNLSKSTYSTKNTIETIDIEEYQKSKYSNALNNFKFISKPVLYQELQQELKITNQKKCIFDVSGLQKDYLVDIYTISHLLNINEIYFFKIKTLKQRTYDDKELIHNLHLGFEYEFENISNSMYTTNTVVTSINDSPYKASFNVIKENYANLFASIFTTISKIILITTTCYFLFIIFKKREKWDTFEPLTFVFLGPLTGWVINLILSLFNSNIEDAVKLKNLHHFIKKWKLKKIENELT